MKTLKYASTGLAVLVIMFGLSAIIGLYANIEFLYRYTPNSVSIAFNSALSFVMIGVLIIACIYKNFYLSVLITAVVSINAVLVLFENIYDLNIGMDQLLFTSYDTISNPAPGRMAPNTAICFILSIIAIILLNNRIKRKLFIGIGCTFSMIVLTVGIISFVGYMSTIFHTFLWGSMTPMSKATATGLIILGITLMVLSFYSSMLKSVVLVRQIPIGLSICIIITTLMLVNEIYDEVLYKGVAVSIFYVTLVFGMLMALMCGLFLHFLILALEARRRLLHSQAALQSTLESTTEGIFVVSLDGKILAHNVRFLKMWGVPENDPSLLNLRTLTKIVVSKLCNRKEYYAKKRQLVANLNYNGRDYLKLSNGSIYERHVVPHIINNKIVGRAFSYRDITEQSGFEARLLHQSTHDPLTELPNLALMLDLVQRAIDSSQNIANNIAIFLIDIDKFSHVNDLFGRGNGDKLLQMITLRMQRLINEHCVLGRIGGDEFLLLHTNISTPESAVTLMRKIILEFEELFEISGNKISITICTGITFYPKDGHTVDELFVNADIALLRAKNIGISTFQFYARHMNEYTLKHMEMETLLRKSLIENNFIVYYQPIIDLNTLKVVGVEALVRLKNESGDLVPPSNFIPLAESLGLITPIGKLVLLQACKQAKAWHAAGFVDLIMAVNISAHQFKFGAVSDTVDQIIKNSGIDPTKLELELTESSFLNTSESVIATLSNITNLGVRLSIDDFGTGFSSFNYVKRFAINKIKIDQSFVQDAVKDDQDRIIVSAMIAMGKNLKFTMLAEGIETLEQQQLMTQLGCSQGQGFLFARPMPAEECTIFLQRSV